MCIEHTKTSEKKEKLNELISELAKYETEDEMVNALIDILESKPNRARFLIDTHSSLFSIGQTRTRSELKNLVDEYDSTKLVP